MARSVAIAKAADLRDNRQVIVAGFAASSALLLSLLLIDLVSLIEGVVRPMIAEW